MFCWPCRRKRKGQANIHFWNTCGFLALIPKAFKKPLSGIALTSLCRTSCFFWPSFGQTLATTWPKLGQTLGGSPPEFGQGLAKTWPTKTRSPAKRSRSNTRHLAKKPLREASDDWGMPCRSSGLGVRRHSTPLMRRETPQSLSGPTSAQLSRCNLSKPY